jgi:predicted glycoside hydrolase/deacetylase ChbG (UPF0249 family)
MVCTERRSYCRFAGATCCTLTMPSVRVAICVDDYGLNRGVDDAALGLAHAGRISAISCMVTAPESAEAANRMLALHMDSVDVGLHLNLTEPPRPALVGDRLARVIMRAYSGRMDQAQLSTEIDRQLDLFEHQYCRAPDFVDGHQHVHQLPVVRDALLERLLDRYSTQRPWIRYTGTSSPLGCGLKYSDRLKSSVIAALGAERLKRLAQKADFRMNSSFLGVYDFNTSTSGYRRCLLHWLSQAVDGSLLMCHPSISPSVSDAIGNARFVEYQVLASDDFDEIIRPAGAVVRTLSEILDRSSGLVST